MYFIFQFCPFHDFYYLLYYYYYGDIMNYLEIKKVIDKMIDKTRNAKIQISINSIKKG